jgi:hypothetical protein
MEGSGDYPASVGWVHGMEEKGMEERSLKTKRKEFGDMRLLKIFILALGFLIIGFPVFADTIQLKDGRSYRGKFIKGDQNGIVWQSEGKIRGFPIGLISSVSFEESDIKEKGIDERGKGLLRGVVTYNQKLDAQRNLGPTPDMGAKVYVCKLKISNIEIFENHEDALHFGQIEGFVKDYLRYRWAKWNQKFLSQEPSKRERDKWELELKKIGADTEKGWMEVRSRGQKVFSKLETGEIPSRVAIAGQDGTFSIMLPAGYYFLLAQSNRSKLDDAYAPVKISEGEITQVFFEMTFLN